MSFLAVLTFDFSSLATNILFCAERTQTHVLSVLSVGWESKTQGTDWHRLSVLSTLFVPRVFSYFSVFPSILFYFPPGLPLEADIGRSLERHSPTDLLAFWANVHNLLTLHASLLLGEPSRSTSRVSELSPLRREYRYAVAEPELLFSLRDIYKIVARWVF